MTERRQNQKDFERRKRSMGQRITLASEAEVQRSVVEYLEWDGWRAIRTEHAIERNGNGDIKRKVGEVGMPDYLFIRYGQFRTNRYGLNGKSEMHSPISEVLWIEFKKRGKSPTNEQFKWHEAERARGALVIVVDDIDAFREDYGRLGLRRRVS